MQTNPAILFQQAIRAHKAGQLEQAEALYRRVLLHQPGHADASHNLGVIAVARGDHAGALQALRAALQANPGQPQYWISCIDALIRVGDVAQAAALLAQGRRQGLQAAAIGELERRINASNWSASSTPSGQPPPAPALQALQALLTAYRTAAPEEAYRLAVQLASRHPQHPLAWTIMARLHRQSGRPEVALHAIERALQCTPGDASLRLDRAELLEELGQVEAAEAACRGVLSSDPENGLAHSLLAVILMSAGRPEEAEASHRQALEVQPDSPIVHGRFCLYLHGRGRLEEAEAAARRVLALRPGSVGALGNLSAILIDRGAFDEAQDYAREALALAPQDVQAHQNLGVALIGLGHHREAADSFRRAIRLDPGCSPAHSNLLYCLNFIAEVSPAQARDEAIEYARTQRAVGGGVVRFTSHHVEPGPRLRVGFVGGDFRAHPVAYFLEALLLGRSNRGLDLLAFPTNEIEDEVSARLKPHFIAWQSIGRLDDDAAARLIHDAGVHVLVDLAGHTAHNRLPVFLRRPAPLQLAWLGYFATTGLEEIDYVLGDPYVTPPGEEDHFVEHVWRLPRTYFCFAPPAVDLPVAPLPALTAGHVTFGCFNKLAKLSDATIALWVRVLEAVPGSCLLLKSAALAHAGQARRTRERFERAGLPPGRLELEGPSAREDYLRAYARVDIALDPFPFPGGTTSVEGLWMGVPVLTRKGDRFIGHNGESILHNSGLPQWIARDEADYVARAMRFASDLDGLVRLRANLRAQLLGSPLFDAAAFASDFEQAIRGMWEERIRTSLRP